jgi:hypothetical protein
MANKRVAKRVGQVFFYKGELFMRCEVCVSSKMLIPMMDENGAYKTLSYMSAESFMNCVRLSGNLSGELTYIPAAKRVEPLNIGEPQWTVALKS